MKLWAVILAMVGVLPSAARAQTVYGPGGLFVHPSAFTPQLGIRANLSWFTQERNGLESQWIPASVIYSADGRTEFGALHVSRRASGKERSSGGFFGRYQFRKESVLGPGIAVVGSYLGGDVQQSSVSAVGSWRVPAARGLAVHSGFQWVRRADLPDTQSDLSRFIALDVPLGRGLRLVGELGSRLKFHRKEASAIGLMWSDHRGFSLGAGFVNTGRSDSARPFIGAGYTIGGNR